LAAIQPQAPPALDHIIKTCLAKDPDERLQSAHDVKSQLQWIALAGVQSGAGTGSTASPAANRLAWWLVALLQVVHDSTQRGGSAPGTDGQLKVILEPFAGRKSAIARLHPEPHTRKREVRLDVVVRILQHLHKHNDRAKRKNSENEGLPAHALILRCAWEFHQSIVETKAELG
jgi:hypothetical protein